MTAVTASLSIGEDEQRKYWRVGRIPRIQHYGRLQLGTYLLSQVPPQPDFTPVSLSLESDWTMVTYAWLLYAEQESASNPSGAKLAQSRSLNEAAKRYI
jgi:hypothetical protein